MEIGGKILIGAAATVAVGLIGHAAAGEKFISGLEQKAQTELAARGLEDASVTFGHDPLSRSAVLDGELTDGNARQEALEIVAAIPGVSGANWKDEEKRETSDSYESAAPVAGSAALKEIAECQATVDKITASEKITFRSGSAYVSPVANRILDKIARALDGCDGLTIAVEGHTDDRGDRAVNRTMSQERADRIKAGLVERGIPEDQITATGYGSSRPLSTGTGAAIDAENRRIEFRVGPAGGSPQNDAKAPQEN